MGLEDLEMASLTETVSTGEREEPVLRERFQSLVAEWKAGRKSTTTAKRMAEHPAYQQIIAMGWDAVPLIIDEMTREPDHWFIALHAITNADPVPESSRGKISEMAQAWITWWRNCGRAR